MRGSSRRINAPGVVCLDFARLTVTPPHSVLGRGGRTCYIVPNSPLSARPHAGNPTGAGMRLSLRFILPLAIALAAIAYAVIPLVDRFTLQWFVRDLDMRTTLITNTIQEPLQDLVREGSRAKVLRFFDRIITDERLFAIGFCDLGRKMIYKTAAFPSSIGCAEDSGEAVVGESRLVNLQRGPIHVAINRVESEGAAYGYLVLVHDMSFVQRRSEDTKKYIFYLFAAIAAIVSLITVVIAEISWRGWVAGLKAVIRGEAFGRGETKVPLRELRPVARDLQALIRDLESERKARDESQINWSADTLRGILRNDLKGEEVLIVSNREPYIHMRRNDRIDRKSTRLNSSHVRISYAVFCLKKKNYHHLIAVDV